MAACAVSAAVLFCFTVWIHGHSAEVVLLSVGQGDAAVIRQSGKTFIVDAGPGYERVLKPYLQSRGITKIDGIFLSHSDQDHSQGVISLLEDPQFKVKTLYLPENPCFDWSGEVWQRAEQTIFIKQGDEIRSRKLIFRCISPFPEFPYEDENSASMCLHLTTKNGTIYMSGDADMAAEHRILQAGENLAAGILKAPHHGSRTSLSEELLQAVDPSLVYISCGRNNSYGHPHEETLERIQKQGAEYWISWQSGALLLQDGHINQYKEVFFTIWMQQARWIR